MRTILRPLPLLLLLAMSAAAQRPTTYPDSARYITEDLPRFWQAFDASATIDPVLAFDSLYLRPASPGLRNFTESRIGSAKNLAATVAARPVYYESIRESTQRIAGQEPAVRAAWRRFKAMYPAAVFPDVYFVVGRLTSGGTTGPAGLLIGAEMYGRTTEDKLVKMSDWHRDVLAPVERLPAIVSHELCHYQQTQPTETTLLARSLREGMCDFVGELISGTALTMKAAEWGRAHEHALWEEFAARMDKDDVSGFLYGGTNQGDRPADLGYFIGYRIAKAYYDRASDKTAALGDLFTVRDAKRLLAESGYNP